MSEESSENAEQPQERQEGWSAPEDKAEPFEIPEYKPLEPLEPALVDALSDNLKPPQNPDLNPYFETLSQEPQGESMRVARPPLMVSVETCPENLMGFCVNCPSCPCSYMKQRVLRALLTELAYGKREENL